jgi:hypothetical protein
MRRERCVGFLLGDGIQREAFRLDLFALLVALRKYSLLVVLGVMVRIGRFACDVVGHVAFAVIDLVEIAESGLAQGPWAPQKLYPCFLPRN